MNILWWLRAFYNKQIIVEVQILKVQRFTYQKNTAAFIFSQSKIEDIIAEPGGYEYHSGQDTIFDGIGSNHLKQITNRSGVWRTNSGAGTYCLRKS